MRNSKFTFAAAVLIGFTAISPVVLPSAAFAAGHGAHGNGGASKGASNSGGSHGSANRGGMGKSRGTPAAPASQPNATPPARPTITVPTSSMSYAPSIPSIASFFSSNGF